MTAKAEELAGRFEVAAKDFEAKVRGLSDSEWKAKTPVEGWSVAATAHHAAGSSAPISMMVQAAATGGEMPPITPDGLNAMNAQHAKQFENCSRDEALALLNETVGPAANLVRGLSDEQLSRKAMLPLGMELSAEQIVELVLIGHLTGHGASIESAVPA